nr:taste receptor type 2 member 1-like [Cavia porcellus]
MLSHHFVIHFIIAVTQFLTGVLTNGFIVVVNVVDFVKHRQMAPLDLLLSCLVISRISLQLIMFLAYLFFLSIIKQSQFAHYYLLFVFVNIWGLWLATWLGVFYCVKISTIPHPVFWLKKRISRLVPWLILGSTLYASMGTAIHRLYALSTTKTSFSNFLSTNATQAKATDSVALYILAFHLTVPFIVFLIAVLLLIFSLGRHAQHMRTMATRYSDSHKATHISALLSILSFLILYFSHYAVAILKFFQFVQDGSFFFMFCTLVAGTYPSIHSVILILGNSKLKQAVNKFLLCGQCGP